jgi:hypothetical protein
MLHSKGLTFVWTPELCKLRCFLVPNFELQILQLKGFNILWTDLMWWVRFLWTPNVIGHSWQSNCSIFLKFVLTEIISMCFN